MARPEDQAPLVDHVLRGEPRALARLITILENAPHEAADILAALYPLTGRAQVVGLTGAPGAGKSTLVDGLIRLLRSRGMTVAVLAVDPSSPYTGGAVLGDRIRMGGHAGDRGVFVRSMGARGRLGGLSRATEGALLALDAAGWDAVLVETVGVGQSELEIAGLADVTAVVLTPAAGDAVQTLKAGILEVADVLVVNKSDMEGAGRLVRDLRAMVAHRPGRGAAIVETEATVGRGLVELWEALQERRAARAEGAVARRSVAGRRVLSAALAALEQDLGRVLLQDDAHAALLDAVADRTLDPQAAARRLLAWWGDTRRDEGPA